MRNLLKNLIIMKQCPISRQTPHFDLPPLFFSSKKFADPSYPSILKKLNPLYEGRPPPSNHVLIKASGNNKIVIEDSRYCVDNKTVYFAVYAVLLCVWIGEVNKRLLPKLLVLT